MHKNYKQYQMVLYQLTSNNLLKKIKSSNLQDLKITLHHLPNCKGMVDNLILTVKIKILI